MVPKFFSVLIKTSREQKPRHYTPPVGQGFIRAVYTRREETVSKKFQAGVQTINKIDQSSAAPTNDLAFSSNRVTQL